MPFRGYWDAHEEDQLRRGVQKHGIGSWERIRHDPEFKVLRCADAPGARGIARGAAGAATRAAAKRRCAASASVPCGAFPSGCLLAIVDFASAATCPRGALLRQRALRATSFAFSCAGAARAYS